MNLESSPASRSDSDLDVAIAAALRLVPAALLVVGPGGRTLLANRRACALLERLRAELEDKPIASILAPLPTLLAAATRDDRSSRCAITLPSGKEVLIGYVIAELGQLDAVGNGPSFVVVLNDVTDFERLREERDRLLHIATMHEVLPSVLHEVKNPLAAIAITSELLVEDAANERTRTRALAIVHEAQRMMLTLQGVGSVGRQLRSKRFAAIDHVIRDACAVLEGYAASRGVLARYAVQDMPLLPLDPSVVGALIFNLSTNAMHACANGGAVEIAVGLVEEGHALSLRVTDTGSGMTPDVLARCRELFFTTKSGGTGIGLALCDRAVTEAGGTMTIESAPGRGTCMTVCIPVGAPMLEPRP